MADHAVSAPPAVPDVRDPDATPAAFAPSPLATGSQQLVKSYKSTLGRGLLAALALHALALSSYWFAVSSAAVPEAPVSIIVDAGGYVAPPPPIDTPPVPPDAPPPAPPAAAPVETGIPEPVAEDIADPDATVAAQDEFNPGDFSGPGVDGPVGGTGTGTFPLPPPLPQPPPQPTPPDEGEDDDADEEPPVFTVVEQMPELIGGLASIRPEYPEMDRRVGLEGRVFLRFVVNEDGSVSDVTVARGVSPGLDAAAVAAVRRARFTPGMQRGRAVKVQFSLPVNFRLD